MILWLLCGVGLGILPVIVNLISPIFTHGSFSLIRPLADGELLLASTAIAGASIGEIFQANIRDARARVRANISLGFTILFCALCAIAYALTRATGTSGGAASTEKAPVLPPSAPPGPPVPLNESGPSSAAAVSPDSNLGPALASAILFLLTIVTAGVCIHLAAKSRERT